jgi:DNA-binding transcriptional LysR family regulator
VSLGRLEHGELDVALLFEYDYVPLPEREEVELVLLLEEPFRVVLPADHPAARQRAVRLVDLADATWICSTPRSSCHPFTERACRAAGFAPRIGFAFDDYQAMQNLVGAEAGVALAPEMAVRTLQPGVATRPIAFQAPRRRIYAAVRRADRQDAGVAAMLAALEEAATGHEAPARSAIGATS